MKLNRLILIILTLLIIAIPNIKYAAVPSADANFKEIKKYIEDGNDLSKVGIDKLYDWFNTIGTDVDLAKKVQNALYSKSASQIKKYIEKDNKTANELATKFENKTGVLEAWKETVAMENDGTTYDLIDKSLKKIENNKEKKQQEQQLQYEQRQKEAKKLVDPTENQDEYKASEAVSGKLQGKVGPILGAIRNIGTVVAVIVLMVIGVKYMLGSLEERANYKQTLLPYLVGAIVLFMASVIPNAIYTAIK